MMRFSLRPLVVITAVVLLAAVIFLWSGSRPDRPTPLADASAPAPVRAADQPDEVDSVPAAAPASRPPAASLTTEDKGMSRTFVVALDEAVVRDADGKDVTVRLDPPATLETLSSRLRDLSPEGGALPVCYEPGQPRTVEYRRIITRDITLHLPAAETLPVLPAGVTLKELPDYAPGFAVVSAADPLAALAALEPLRAHPQVVSADVQLAAQLHPRALPNDPLVNDEWHIKYQGQFGAVAGSDVNVESVWDYEGTGGVRGNGIRIGIVDDGMQNSHPDLVQNADTANDYDWNGGDTDASPSPVDNHGTACAGNAAARGNNGFGVTGTAPEATLVGMRLIAAATTDSQEAAAMAHASDIIQIKSNSWGPPDWGTLVSGPGSLTRAAIANAAANGRGGRGTVFLWAAGNGLENDDNSNKDGFANDIHAIAVSASDSQARQAWYSEPGSNILLCAPSSGDFLGITTTDLVGAPGYSDNDYTDSFGGTSSATPTVAGIVALMLEKNPNLGYRDVQEILMRTAATIHPGDAGWSTNGAGFDFNNKYGAGRVDAAAAVAMADGWTNLAASTTQTISQTGINLPIPDNNPAGITRTFDFTGPVLRVEHAVVTFSATHGYRGDLRIVLVSPSGMESVLVDTHGDPNDNYSSWRFSTVHHWGEDSTGTWTVRVSDGSSVDTGLLTSLSVSLQGTLGSGVNPGPAVQITSPAPGAGFSPGATVTAVVAASDLNANGTPGTVVSVELLDNGVSRGIDTEAPYEFTFQPPLGLRDLVAIATDAEGAVSTSSPVTINIADQPPVVGAASLTAAGQSFADQPLSVTGVESSDPEDQQVTLAYEWEKSDDDDIWTAAGGTSATLAPSPGNAGYLWRCRIIPSDGIQSGEPYVTSKVNLLVRPPAAAPVDVPFSYDSGLVLRDADATVNRQVILNEFSQGSSAGVGEWVELLTLRPGSFRNWRLSDASGVQLVFKDDAVWDAIPAGTLIVIYNAAAKDPLLPADDGDLADGKLVLSSGNAAYFTGSWPGFADDGDGVVVRDPANALVAAFSYGTTTAFQPRLGPIGSAGAAFYTGSSDAGSSSASGWKITTAAVARGPMTRAVGDLFFSEYVEGSNSIRFLEIYNPSSSPVDLAAQNYTIQIYAGATSPGTPIALTGTIIPGDVFVIKDSSVGTSVITDQIATNLDFDGNDAIVLRKGTAVVDCIGQVGTNPGTAWSGGSVSTKDKTLRRKPSVHRGDTITDDAFNPSVEWLDFVKDTTGGLSQHTIDPYLTVSVNPASFMENAGPLAAVGTVTLSSVAPTGGALVVLASSDTSAATVPASVTVPAGQTSVNFNVAAVNDSNSDGSQVTEISAFANGFATGEFQVTVLDDEPSLDGVTPVAGNTQSNTTYVANLRTGVYEGPSAFRFGAASNTPAGLAIDAATGIVSGTPTGPLGNYAIVIERFNARGESVTQSFTLALTDGTTGYPAWIAGYPGLPGTEPGDDPDFDSLENLLEYYFGTHPGTADAAGALPVLAKDGNTLTLTWWRMKAATDATGTAEWSDALGTWSPDGITTEVIADEPTREQVRATLVVGPGEEMKFLRLKVE